MTRGQVKWFDPKKGFGFIHGPSGQDVFVHYSHISSEGFRALKDGEWVDYELIEGDKGWQARSVQQIADQPPSDNPAAAPSAGAEDPAPPSDAPPIGGGYQGTDDSSPDVPPASSGYEGS
ncbi:MAG: cold-shock protein [Planctomycetota bacterium]|jgi:CspA family cold shock protein